jgi:homocysteine S-methyltransferase
MGTELQRRGVELPLPLWSAEANHTHPEVVRAIHRDYAAAGADILTTNTFRTTIWTYRRASYGPRNARDRARDRLFAAVDHARSVAGDTRLVAGSIAPLEDCYQPERFPGVSAAQDEFGQLGEWFQAAGVDLLLLETMGHLEEIRAALEVTTPTGLPRWVSFILRDGDQLLGGHPLEDALAAARQAEVAAVLLNCNSLPLTADGIPTVTRHWSGPWGVYPNLGRSRPEPDGSIHELVPPAEFLDRAREFLEAGARIIGACCGSTPEYIRGLRELVDFK